VFTDAEVRKAIEQMKGQPDHFDEVGFYLRALAKTEDVIVEQTENLHLGKLRTANPSRGEPSQASGRSEERDADYGGARGSAQIR
jgi:hypothetical protein